jgi:hypothetical protein
MLQNQCGLQPLRYALRAFRPNAGLFPQPVWPPRPCRHGERPWILTEKTGWTGIRSSAVWSRSRKIVTPRTKTCPWEPRWKWTSFRHCATGEGGTPKIESKWTASKREAERKKSGELLCVPPLRQKRAQGWGTHIHAGARMGAQQERKNKKPHPKGEVYRRPVRARYRALHRVSGGKENY